MASPVRTKPQTLHAKEDEFVFVFNAFTILAEVRCLHEPNNAVSNKASGRFLISRVQHDGAGDELSASVSTILACSVPWNAGQTCEYSLERH